MIMKPFIRSTSYEHHHGSGRKQVRRSVELVGHTEDEDPSQPAEISSECAAAITATCIGRGTDGNDDGNSRQHDRRGHVKGIYLTTPTSQQVGRAGVAASTVGQHS